MTDVTERPGADFPHREDGEERSEGAVVDAALAEELVARAREQGIELLGEHGLLLRQRLRLRLFTIPATLARSARRTVLHLADKAPWAHLAVSATTRLRALAAPT